MSNRILIVEDDFTSRTLLMRSLERYGTCEVAVDGKEALTAFDRATAERSPYTLICLDLMMPKLSGSDVLKTIRQKESEAGVRGRDGVKIIVTTGMEGSDVMFDSFRSGCEAFLKKPLDLTTLHTTLLELGFEAI